MSSTVLLGDICDVRDGTHDSPKPKKSGHPLITSKHIKNNQVDLTSSYFISNEDYDSVNRRSKVDKFDLLLSMIGTVGELAFIDYEPGFAIKNVGLIKTGDELLGRYLFYYLQSSKAKKYLEQSSTGSTQEFISLGQLRRLPIDLPPQLVQERVVDILWNIDRKINLNRRMNETLKQIGQAIFKRWFIDFEFPNENGSFYKTSGGRMKDSSIGKIPENWTISKIGEIISTIESGSRPQGGAIKNGVPSIGAENIDGLGVYDYSKEKYISESYFKNLNRGVVKNEDILLYKDGAYVGKKSLFMDGFPHRICAVNEHVFILRTNHDLPSQFFLYLWLDQDNITKRIKDAGVKAAQPGINQDDVNRLPVLQPNATIIKLFDANIRPVMKYLFNNANQSRNLTQLRDSLLPKLISGKVKV